MEDRDGVIWMDGQLVPWRDARVHVLSYTFQHGFGVFEGVRAYEGALGTAVFRLSDHTDRLFESAKILGMEIPFTPEELNEAQLALVKAGGLASCYLRPVAFCDGKTAGVSARGNDVHVAIAAWEWKDYLGSSAQQNGMRVKTSSFSRHHINAAMVKAKATGHYINSGMAADEAKRMGFDDAMMLDTYGFVSECSTSNIFVVSKGRIATPDRTTILQGITRDTMMVLAQERGFTVEERRITRDELYVADEIFVTGTAAEVTPVVQLDHAVIGQGSPGPLTKTLQEDFRSAVAGRLPSKQHWLTAVEEPPSYTAIAEPAQFR
jgi:branched-chain amino acid aminotransferase